MAFGLAVCALGITRRAAAFPTSRLVYARGPGAEQCPEQEAVRQAVATRLGYDPFFPASDKTIVARILRDSDRLRGEVELIDEHGVELGLREFSAEANQCEDLVRAMALSISIAIDPKSAETYAQGPPDEPLADSAKAPESAEPAPRRAPLPAPPSAASPPLAPTPKTLEYDARNEDTAPEPVARPLQWSAGLGVLGELGVVPELAPALFGFASARRGAWSLAIEGRGNLPASAERGGVSFSTSSYALDLAPCVHLGVAFACEVTALDWLSASGTQAAAQSGTSLSLLLGGRLGVEFPVASSVGVVADGEMLVNPWPERIVASGQGSAPLWREPALSGAFGLALAVHF